MWTVTVVGTNNGTLWVNSSSSVTGDNALQPVGRAVVQVLGPIFKDVNLLTMRRNATSGRLVIEIFCAYKKGAKKA